MVILFQIGTELREKPKEMVNYEFKLISLANDSIKNEQLRNWTIGKISEMKGHFGNTETLSKAGAALIMCASQLEGESAEKIKNFVLAAEKDISSMLKKTPPDMERFAADLNRSRAGQPPTFTGSVTLAEQVPQKVEKPAAPAEIAPQAEADKLKTTITSLSPALDAWDKFKKQVEDPKYWEQQDKEGFPVLKELLGKFWHAHNELSKQRDNPELPEEQRTAISEALRTLDGALGYIGQMDKFVKAKSDAKRPEKTRGAYTSAKGIIQKMVDNPEQYGFEKGSALHNRLSESLKNVSDERAKSDTGYLSNILYDWEYLLGTGVPTRVFGSYSTDTAEYSETRKKEVPVTSTYYPQVAGTYYKHDENGQTVYDADGTRTTFELTYKDSQGVHTGPEAYGRSIIKVQVGSPSNNYQMQTVTNYTVNKDSSGNITSITFDTPPEAMSYITLLYELPTPITTTIMATYTQDLRSRTTTGIGSFRFFVGTRDSFLGYTSGQWQFGESSVDVDYTITTPDKPPEPKRISRKIAIPTYLNIINTRNPEKGFTVTELSLNTANGRWGVRDIAHVGATSAWITDRDRIDSGVSFDSNKRKEIWNAWTNLWKDRGAITGSFYGKHAKELVPGGETRSVIGGKVAKQAPTFDEQRRLAQAPAEERMEFLVFSKSWKLLRDEINKVAAKGRNTKTIDTPDLATLVYAEKTLTSVLNTSVLAFNLIFSKEDRKEMEKLLDTVKDLREEAGYRQGMLSKDTSLVLYEIAGVRIEAHNKFEEIKAKLGQAAIPLSEIKTILDDIKKTEVKAEVYLQLERELDIIIPEEMGERGTAKNTIKGWIAEFKRTKGEGTLEFGLSDKVEEVIDKLNDYLFYENGKWTAKKDESLLHFTCFKKDGFFDSLKKYAESLNTPEKSELAMAFRGEILKAISDLNEQASKPDASDELKDGISHDVAQLYYILNAVVPQGAVVEGKYFQRDLRIATEMMLKETIAGVFGPDYKVIDEKLPAARKQFSDLMDYFIANNVTGLRMMEGWVRKNELAISTLGLSARDFLLPKINNRIEELKKQGIDVGYDDSITDDRDFALFYRAGEVCERKGELTKVWGLDRDTGPLKRGKWKIAEKYFKWERLSPEQTESTSTFVLFKDTLQVKGFYHELEDVSRYLSVSALDRKWFYMDEDHVDIVGFNASFAQDLMRREDSFGLGAILDLKLLGGLYRTGFMGSLMNGLLEVQEYGIGDPQVKGTAIALHDSRASGENNLGPLIRAFTASYIKDPEGFKQLISGTARAGSHTFWVEFTEEATKGTKTPETHKYLVTVNYVGNSLVVSATDVKNISKERYARLDAKKLGMVSLGGLKAAPQIEASYRTAELFKREGVLGAGIRDVGWTAGLFTSFYKKGEEGKLKPWGSVRFGVEDFSRKDVFHSTTLNLNLEKINKWGRYNVGATRTTVDRVAPHREEMGRSMFTLGISHLTHQNLGVSLSYGPEKRKYLDTGQSFTKMNFEGKLSIGAIGYIRYIRHASESDGVIRDDGHGGWKIEANVGFSF
ncbi:MAG: hypothetical protein AB1468_01460 [Candidatus Micrarchaeota archaeon]